MADLSDGFLCLPGGPGTFEEIFEQWTWALLGIHAKPCGFVNVSGYYDLMRADDPADGRQRLHRPDLRRHAGLRRRTTPQVLEAFRTYVAPPPKWSTNKP